MRTNELQSKVDSQFISPDDERWTAYLSTNQLANVFHHPAWSCLLAESYAYEPLVFAAFNSQGDIVAAIPLIRIRSLFNKQRLVSLPFTDHCSPLFSSRSTLQYLTDRLVAQANEDKISRIDLRSDYPLLPGMHRCAHYVLHRIRLAPEESEVSNRIKPKHFRQIKVAEQRGVRIERGTDTDFVRQFYHMHTLTRRRKGVPVQPWRFFDLLVQHITHQGLGFVLLAYKDQECIAGAVFLNWNKTLVYKYSASVAKARKLLAMDLLLWTAIQWGCENGYEWMDMGRTNKEDEGLRYFKRRWGAEETPLHYCTISESAQEPASGEWAKRAESILQRSPPWVCRVTGELLYRYFG
ncbi:MAG: GNAT family N-acetyltransferase [Anaerolineae bacterium]|jgi:hypothetical protein